MLQKAPAAMLGIGQSGLSRPPAKRIDRSELVPPTTGFAAGAVLSIEEDFELGSDFLLVFKGASERVAGFVIGCAAIGIAWAMFSFW